MATESRRVAAAESPPRKRWWNLRVDQGAASGGRAQIRFVHGAAANDSGAGVNNNQPTTTTVAKAEERHWKTTAAGTYPADLLERAVDETRR